MNKNERAQKVNEAISRSEVAKAREAKAEVTKEGYLVYRMFKNGSLRIVRYDEIAWLLNGEDVRSLRDSV